MNGNPATPREIPAASGTAIEGTWYVKTAAGVLSLTLDQLDQAFQRGNVDAATPVFTAGMTAWSTLGALANLDEPEPVTDAGGGARREAAPADEELEIGPEPSDGGSFPPTTTGVFGATRLPWASIAAPETEGHTVVRRRSVVPYPLRKAAGCLADYAANLQMSRPRLAAAGPWLFGAALSGIFIVSLYQLGAASTRPGARTKSGWITARTTTANEGPVATPVITLPAAPPARAEPAPAPPKPAPVARAAADDTVDESAILRANELELEPSHGSGKPAARAARASRGKTKAAKASASKKAKARARRAMARNSGKRPSSQFDIQ